MNEQSQPAPAVADPEWYRNTTAAYRSMQGFVLIPAALFLGWIGTLALFSEKDFWPSEILGSINKVHPIATFTFLALVFVSNKLIRKWYNNTFGFVRLSRNEKTMEIKAGVLGAVLGILAAIGDKVGIAPFSLLGLVIALTWVVRLKVMPNNTALDWAFLAIALATIGAAYFLKLSHPDEQQGLCLLVTAFLLLIAAVRDHRRLSNRLSANADG